MAVGPSGTEVMHLRIKLVFRRRADRRREQRWFAPERSRPTYLPAERRKLSTSRTVNSRHAPRGRRPSLSGPRRVRVRRFTL